MDHNSAQKKTRIRCRATVACEACRLRRSKCVMVDSQKECERCRRNSLTCVVMDNDRRKSSTSKDEVNSLKERVAYLENTVRNQREFLSVAASERTCNNGKEDNDQERETRRSQSSESSSTALLPVQVGSLPCAKEHDIHEAEIPESHASLSPLPSLLNQILSTRGHWSYDRGGHNLRYFGSTTNLAVYFDINDSDRESDYALPDQKDSDETVLRSLSPQTHDYLLDLYMKFYNSVLPIVNQTAFLADMGKEEQPGCYYSRLLHICVLAMGFRFADLDRPDIRSLLINNGQNTILHKEAQRMLENEMSIPGGIPTIQAFLLMSDLTCGAGRERSGWMYAGMACLRALDLGLHADCTKIGLPERDVEIRHQVLWACVLVDEYWSLLLGRRPAIRRADLAVSILPKDLDPTTECPKSLEAIVFEASRSLMGLAGTIFETMEHMPATLDIDSYQVVIRLVGELDVWKLNLPQCLKWNPTNTKTAPASFFLLYQQYHTLLILLHRPFARPDSREASQEDGCNDISVLSRKVCFDNATHIANIFKYHTRHFNGRQIMVFSLDHASAAATAIIHEILCLPNQEDKLHPIKILYWLVEAIETIAPTYYMAQKFLGVLQAVLKDNGWHRIAEDRDEHRGITSPHDRRSSWSFGIQNGPLPKRRRLQSQVAKTPRSMGEGEGGKTHLSGKRESPNSPVDVIRAASTTNYGETRDTNWQTQPYDQPLGQQLYMSEDLGGSLPLNDLEVWWNPNSVPLEDLGAWSVTYPEYPA